MFVLFSFVLHEQRNIANVMKSIRSQGLGSEHDEKRRPWHLATIKCVLCANIAVRTLQKNKVVIAQ